MRTSDRFQALPPYHLAGIPNKKRLMIERGVDVIDLGAGDADLPAPPAAVEALTRTAQDPAMSRYGFGLGHLPYREAVSAWMERRFGQRFNPLTEIAPLLGSKEGLAHFCLATLQKGDVAIVPDPGYIVYQGGAVLADAEPYLYALTPRTDFLLELDDVPSDVLRRTKVLFLNYPNNPTAAIAPMEYLERVVARCRELGIILAFDNAYSEMTFDGYVAPSIFEVSGAREIAVEFHSLSKTYNMTGWRCGWACGNSTLIGALAKTKSFVDTGHFMPIQAAGVAALESHASWLPGNLATFKTRRDAAVEAFRAQGFAVAEAPKATMYLWVPLPPDVRSQTFHEALFDDEGVIVLPGASLGAGGEGFFRVSCIVDPTRLVEAAERAGRVLRRLRRPEVTPEHR